MLVRATRVAFVGLVIATSLTACSAEKPAISPENAAKAQAVGARLAAQEAADAAKHKAEIAKLIRAELSHVHERDRTMSLTLGIVNYTAKTVKSLEFGLEVDDASGKALGRAELRTAQTIGPKASASITFNFPYTKFGSGTGAVREALGKPKRYLLDVKEIKYTDGSDAGYDD